MSHDDQSSRREEYVRSNTPETSPQTSRAEAPTEPPASSSWSAVAPWGTPGNHLTGPIPRIRRRSDGSLTHDGTQGEES